MSDMDETWSQLPLDILQRVVSLLPLVPLFRCRVVCKQWNAWINELVHPQTPAQNAEIFIVSNSFGGLADNRYWFALDTCINKWYKIDCRSWSTEPRIRKECIPRAAHRNVVLAEFVKYGEPREELIVCNPVSRVRYLLSAELVPGSCYEIVVDDNSKSYKVYLLSDVNVLGTFDRRISEYSSTDNSWTKLCSIPELSNNCVPEVHLMTVSEEFVHLLVFVESDEPEELSFYSLCSYSMIENSWGELVGSEIPLFREHGIYIHHMFMYRGQLLLVGTREAISNCGNRIRVNFLVWRFSFTKKECVVIAEMPPDILRTVQTGTFIVSGRGDQIFFLTQQTKMVIYCVRDGSWHCPPDLAAHDRLPEFARCALFQKFVSFTVGY